MCMSAHVSRCRNQQRLVDILYIHRSVKTTRQRMSVKTKRKPWRSTRNIFIICKHAHRHRLTSLVVSIVSNYHLKLSQQGRSGRIAVSILYHMEFPGENMRHFPCRLHGITRSLHGKFYVFTHGIPWGIKPGPIFCRIALNKTVSRKFTSVGLTYIHTIYPHMPILRSHAARFHERRISSVTFTSAHLCGNIYMRVGVACALASSFDFGFLGEQSIQNGRFSVLEAYEPPCKI